MLLLPQKKKRKHNCLQLARKLFQTDFKFVGTRFASTNSLPEHYCLPQAEIRQAGYAHIHLSHTRFILLSRSCVCVSCRINYVSASSSTFTRMNKLSGFSFRIITAPHTTGGFSVIVKPLCA